MDDDDQLSRCLSDNRRYALFTLEALRVAAGEAWERTLYGGLRAQQQRAMVCRRLAAEARRRGEERTATRYEQRAWDYEEGAATLRRLLAEGGEAGEGDTDAGS
jgi:hypothetical protein